MMEMKQFVMEELSPKPTITTTIHHPHHQINRQIHHIQINHHRLQMVINNQKNNQLNENAIHLYGYL